MNVDLNELYTLAKAATPGPWFNDSEWSSDDVSIWSGEPGDSAVFLGNVGSTPFVEVGVAFDVNTANGKFISAANPAVIMALIERVRQLESKTAVTMGVGDGSGQRFVHGDYDSIKVAQAIVLENESLHVELANAKAEQIEIHSQLEVLKSEAKGPIGFATWKDAAVHERLKRVEAESAKAAIVNKSEGKIHRIAESVKAALRAHVPTGDSSDYIQVDEDSIVPIVMATVTSIGMDEVMALTRTLCPIGFDRQDMAACAAHLRDGYEQRVRNLVGDPIYLETATMVASRFISAILSQPEVKTQ